MHLDHMATLGTPLSGLHLKVSGYLFLLKIYIAGNMNRARGAKLMLVSIVFRIVIDSLCEHLKSLKW